MIYSSQQYRIRGFISTSRIYTMKVMDCLPESSYIVRVGTHVSPISNFIEYKPVALRMDWCARNVFRVEQVRNIVVLNSFILVPVTHPIYIGFIVHKQYIRPL